MSKLEIFKSAVQSLSKKYKVSSPRILVAKPELIKRARKGFGAAFYGGYAGVPTIFVNLNELKGYTKNEVIDLAKEEFFHYLQFLKLGREAFHAIGSVPWMKGYMEVRIKRRAWR